MCNGDADGEELPQVTTNHHQVNDGKRGKPDDISDVQEKVKVEPWSHDGHYCKERPSFLKECATQRAGKCKCSPASRKTHPPSWKYKWVQRKIQKQIDLQQIQVRVIFRIFDLTFPFPYLWADWERGLKVCSKRIAPGDLIIKCCYFQLQQLLYNLTIALEYNHSHSMPDHLQ